MGKVRRRQKYSTPGKENPDQKTEEKPVNANERSDLPLYVPETDDIFTNMKMDYKKNNKVKFILDDARSEKSFKSIKSDLSLIRQMSKKDKRVLKHNLIMKRLSIPYCLKKNMLLKSTKNIDKRKLISDSIGTPLQSLLKKQSATIEPEVKTKKKSTEKEVKRRKNMIKSMNKLKYIFKNKPERFLTSYLTEQVKKNIEKRKL